MLHICTKKFVATGSITSDDFTTCLLDGKIINIEGMH